MSEATEGKPVSGELPTAPKIEPIPTRHRPSGVQQLGTAALAILLYLLLLDSAVETLLSGSPVRWIVAVAVAGYFALNVPVWRRFSWDAKAAVSLLVLLGLLAATAWLPEGLSHGMTLLGQPTSIVLAGVTFLAILVAGVILIQWRFVPLLGRLAAGLSTAYGLAAIGLGIAQGTPYSDLFHGRSLWDHLPFWLQGVFIGAAVIMPIALLIHIVDGVWRVRGTQLRRWEVQGIALSLSVVIAAAAMMASTGSALAPPPQVLAPLAGTATPSPVQAPQQSTVPSQSRAQVSPAPPPQTVTSPNPSVPQVTITPDELVRILKAYQKLPKGVDRSAFDVKAKAAKLGGDVTAAFTFVRDQISNEVYPGVLRGPDGTLSAHAGNDLDKALLLGTLLAEQKHQVRYAQCILTEDLSQERIRAMFSEPSPAALSDISLVLKAAMIREGIPEQRVLDFVGGRKSLHEALDDAVFRTAQVDLAIVQDALKRAGIKPKPGANQAGLLEEARTHYWIQVEDSGAWADLDPSFPKARSGQTFCAARKTYAELPADDYQYITFKVRNEYLEGGKLHNVFVLERMFSTFNLHGQAILFTNLPVPSNDLFGGGIAAARNFVPTLMVGDLVFSGEEFQIESGGPAGPSGLFGEVLGDARGDSGPQLVGQWLDFELKAPGRIAAVSRAIVDTVDPEERAKGTLTAAHDLDLVKALLVEPYAVGVSTGRLDEMQAIEAAYSQLDVDAAGRAFAADAGGPSTDQTLRDVAAIAHRMLILHVLSFVSTSDRALSGPWLTGYPHARVFRDQPLIAIVNLRFRLSADRQYLFGGLSLDVRHDAVRVVGETSDWQKQGFWLSAHVGLIDGALERHLVPYLAMRLTGQASPLLDGLSTSAVFDLARSQGLEVQALPGREAVRLLQQEFVDTGGYRLASELAEDVAAVLPNRVVTFQREDRLGLWVVNLVTGHIVALLDTGLRGDMVEESLLQNMQYRRKVLMDCLIKQAIPAPHIPYTRGLNGCGWLFDLFEASVRVLWRQMMGTAPIPWL